MRRYIVQYLQNKFDPERHILPVLNDQYFEYFRKALDNIFLIDGLLDLTNSNEKIRQQVILDILYWLRKSYTKARIKNPFEDEQQRLEGWSVTPLHVFVNRWGALPNYLKSEYPREKLDTYFFNEKFKSLIATNAIADISTANQKEIELILHDLLAQWDALLLSLIHI